VVVRWDGHGGDVDGVGDEVFTEVGGEFVVEDYYVDGLGEGAEKFDGVVEC
jgi:hypothetical protein